MTRAGEPLRTLRASSAQDILGPDLTGVNGTWTGRAGAAVPDQEAEERFEQFCADADLKTPARAAEELRRYRVPDVIVDELVERYERHVGAVRDVAAPHYMQSG